MKRISERSFSHLMVRKLFPPMGTSHLFFIYIFFLKEHLNTISTRRPTFKPNSLRGCVRTTFCDVYPLPKVLELLRKNVGLSWPSVGLQEAHLQRILSGMQEGRDSDGDHCQGHRCQGLAEMGAGCAEEAGLIKPILRTGEGADSPHQPRRWVSGKG